MKRTRRTPAPRLPPGAQLANEARRLAQAIELHAGAGVRLMFAPMLAAACRPPRSPSFVAELLTSCRINVAAWLPASWSTEEKGAGSLLIHTHDPERILELRWRPRRPKSSSSWLTLPNVSSWQDELYRPL